MNVLILNGGVGGAHGNSAALLKHLQPHLQNVANVQTIALVERLPEIAEIQKADAFVFLTGTYWDSWGSPLQKFLEAFTEHETSELWLGKPAAVIVTMHSVGGKAVLSRLQGVLTTWGCLIPPLGGMVYSALAQTALRADFDGEADCWRPEDLAVVAHNLLAAASLRASWQRWPVDGEDAKRRWLE